MKKVIGAIVVAIILYGAYYTLSPLFITVELAEPVPDDVAEVLVAERPIVETPTHPASGKVSVVRTASETLLRYEDFSTINGPDLFIYLSSDLEATEFVNLGRIRATEGSVNYVIPDDVDLSQYPYALVWCKRFGVLFNYADITLAP